MDFMKWLEFDTSMKIFLSLDDPSDLVHVSAVSRSWYHFVVANGLCKQLCLRMFPQLSSVACVEDEIHEMENPVDVGSSSSGEWASLVREHRAYAFLAQAFTSFAVKNCIRQPITASSTDNYPEESILNTLEPRDRIENGASYWSSQGQKDPSVHETLIYSLVGDLCVINEINVQPFQAFFQPGSPIYSAKSVRFRMGHFKSPIDPGRDLMEMLWQQSADESIFVWTHTSQEFPMAQENRLQKFKLPEPVLCIGGVLEIELLGRVQRQEMDGKFYICVAHVQVLGKVLSGHFKVPIIEPSGKFLLKYNSHAVIEEPNASPNAPRDLMERHVRGGWEHIIDMMLGNVPEVEVINDWEINGEEMDDDDDEEIIV